MTASNKKKGVRKASVKTPKKTRKSRRRAGNLSNLLSGAIELFTVLIDRFGWPGAFIILAYISVERWATPDQKRAIIEKYVLGVGISEVYPLIILCIVAAALLAAQHYHWKKRVGVLEYEIKRLAEWKSAYQDANIDATLHHSQASKGD
ncbi:MAG: hypothetical protein HWN51_07035 [Desulfobacterales bacterium]|nr:hypothetical protein [Desulfobacterales bacterium]